MNTFFFFFWSSPNFGPKTGLNLSEEFFFWSLLYSNSPLPPFENPAFASGYTELILSLLNASACVVESVV